MNLKNLGVLSIKYQEKHKNKTQPANKRLSASLLKQQPKYKVTRQYIFSHTSLHMSPTNFSDDLKLHPAFPAINSDMITAKNLEPDIQILTSGGQHIPAHATLLVHSYLH